MSPLWTPAELVAVTGGTLGGAVPAAITGASIDTRTLEKGDAFFAIRGDNRDGHVFVPAALDKGAGVAVVAADQASAFGPGARLLIVPDVLEALVKLGLAARARVNAKIIAVTGSVGKTSTKEALRLAFERQGVTHASVASYNNHWGVPLTLARMPRDTAWGIFEIGMNHAGEIRPLTAMVRPDIAIVTTVAAVHIEHFPSIEAIADAKAEIFEGLPPGGTVIINRDNPFHDRLRAAAGALGLGEVISFGEAKDAGARLISCDLHATFSTVEADILGDKVVFRLGAPGRHLVSNALAVLAAVKTAGADLALAALALATLAQPAGRGRRLTLGLPLGRATLIDESYNANPVSMRAALSLLASADVGFRGRRIAVLGDMLELGPQEVADHQGLAGPIAEAGCDLVFLAGPRMKHLWQTLPLERRGGYAEVSAGLVAPLAEALRPGDVLVVKGSLGSKMGPLVSALAERFPAPAEPQPAG